MSVHVFIHQEPSILDTVSWVDCATLSDVIKKDTYQQACR